MEWILFLGGVTWSAARRHLSAGIDTAPHDLLVTFNIWRITTGRQVNDIYVNVDAHNKVQKYD